MSRKPIILAIVLLIAGSLAASNGDAKGKGHSPASSEAELTNKAILAMVKGGLSSDVIIAKIQTSTCAFDTSPAALIELKSAGVPETVILAMVKSPNQATSKGEPTHSAPLASPPILLGPPQIRMPVIPSAPQVMLGPLEPIEPKLPVMQGNAQRGSPLEGVPGAPSTGPAFNPPMPSAPNATSERAPNETSALQDVISGRVPCNDPRILSADTDTSRGRIGPVDRKDFNFIMCVATRLIRGNRIALPPGFGQIWAIVPFHSQQINSEMVPKNGVMAVLAFDSMAKFVNYDQDEEAFVIGHEIGHILAATYCASIRAQANQAILFKQLALNHAQQVCEEHADLLGLQYMWGAGFNPFAAGAALGRFEMYFPDQTRGIASTIANFLEDHPISSERIKILREETIRLCSQPGTVCHER